MQAHDRMKNREEKKPQRARSKLRVGIFKPLTMVETEGWVRCASFSWEHAMGGHGPTTQLVATTLCIPNSPRSLLGSGLGGAGGNSESMEMIWDLASCPTRGAGPQDKWRSPQNLSMPRFFLRFFRSRTHSKLETIHQVCQTSVISPCIYAKLPTSSSAEQIR